MKCVLLIFLPFYLFGEWHVEYERGDQTACGFTENGLTRSRPYVFAKTTSEHFEASARLWYDFIHSHKDLEIRSLFYKKSAEQWSLKVGFQEIAWGETFGLYIADLVNPRDYTDPFFNDLGWIRLATFTLNAQYFKDAFSAQLVVTPIPRNNWLPTTHSPFNVLSEEVEGAKVRGPSKFKIDRCGRDVEYGLRVGYLFESGVDITAFYFRHWNRNPAYRLRLDSHARVFKPVLRRIQTVGASFSRAWEKIVWRGDAVWHLREPWTVHRLGVIKRRGVFRTILGADYTSDEGRTLGFQFHVDAWREAILCAVSFKYVQDFGGKKQYHAEFFAYHGLNDWDLWLQPQLGWDFADSWNLSLRCDILGGKIGNGLPQDGFIGPYREKSRIFAWLRHHF